MNLPDKPQRALSAVSGLPHRGASLTGPSSIHSFILGSMLRRPSWTSVGTTAFGFSARYVSDARRVRCQFHGSHSRPLLTKRPVLSANKQNGPSGTISVSIPLLFVVSLSCAYSIALFDGDALIRIVDSHPVAAFIDGPAHHRVAAQARFVQRVGISN